MDRTLYPGHVANWDDVLFRERLVSVMDGGSTILDYGAGRGNVVQMHFRGSVSTVAGVDIDTAVLGNPHLDEAAILDPVTGRIPFEDAKFDLVFADNVMEHVDDPIAVFLEIGRVLKPGGIFLAKTPNKWHYMPLIARCTPIWFHRFYNHLRGRSSVDTFPTVYRCNQRKAVERSSKAAGLKMSRIDFIEGRPEYLRLFAVTYLIGWFYERLVNSARFFAPF
jgi:SAM-dependent methyltransferase